MAKEQDEETRAYIVALLEERRGYETYGDDAGMAAIDKELARVGHQAEKPSKRAETRKK